MIFTEVAFSCYPATDLAKSRGFYEGILGLKPNVLIIHKRKPGHH